MIWDQRVTTIPGVGPKRAQLLEEIGIRTVADLALTLPTRYIDAAQVKDIAHLLPNEVVTLHAEVIQSRLIRTRARQDIVTATVADQSGKLTITFFHQPYVVKKLPQGEKVALMGKTAVYKNKLTLINPTVESLEKDEQVHTGRIIPIYRQHETLKTTWIRQTLFSLLKAALPEVQDPLLEPIRQKESLMGFSESLWQAHFPDSFDQVKAARRRLAFTELWDVFAQLRQQDQENRRLTAAATMESSALKKFFLAFQKESPFPLTDSQAQACRDLDQLLTQKHPGFHLVQGEVGSGKTLVAAYALCAVAQSGTQALYLAPTTILAQQHFQAIEPIAQQLGIQVELWTGQSKKNISAPILIGTHALFHKSENFQPGVVIVDEEHRFGVRQRALYWERTKKPHLISMTATPIPRTLAHALYGTHSTSHLDVIPGKEKRITTRAFEHTRLQNHFSWLEKELAQNKQAFLVAPFINPSETEGLTEVYDAESLFERAKTELPQTKIALLTGNTKPEKKTKILEAMRNGKLDILVATPVIEVGIDIPAASIITIFSAERFGLAQLHQLRGRVGRAGQESWCFLVPSPNIPISERLKKMETLSDGSQLAELDLKTRGIGEFLGTRQSGWDTLRTADWLDLELIEQVKRVQAEMLD